MVPPRSPPAARRSISLPRAHSVSSPTTGSSHGPNSVEEAPGSPARCARALDHRHLHAEADAEERHPALAREAHRLDLALACRARRSRRGRGCRARLPAAPPCPAARRSGCRPSRVDTLHAVGDAAMRQRLGERFVAVEQVRVLADDRDAHLALRRAHRVDDALPARQIGLAAYAAGRNGAAPPDRAPRRGSASARRRSCRRRAPRSPPPGARCRTARSCAARCPGSAGRQRQSSRFAWMPTFSSSFTECCVGLVFSSPAERM